MFILQAHILQDLTRSVKRERVTSQPTHAGLQNVSTTSEAAKSGARNTASDNIAIVANLISVRKSAHSKEEEIVDTFHR